MRRRSSSLLALAALLSACDDAPTPPLPPLAEGTSLPPLPAPSLPRTFPREGTRITPYVIDGFPEARTPGPGAAPVPPVLLSKLPAGEGFAHEGSAETFSLNRVRVLAFTEEPPAAEPAAVVVLVPGLLAGASSFLALGTALVQEGRAAGRPIVVLAVDRRSNFLEDPTGQAVALQSSDPTPAAAYHGLLGQPPTPIAGRAASPVEAADARFVSEWGLDVHVRDLREVIELGYMLGNRAPVFLGGHSFGATMATAFAAYEFGEPGGHSDPGHGYLAGLVFLDGAPSPAESVTDDEALAAAQSFLQGGAGFGGLPAPGLVALREGMGDGLMPYPWLEVPGILDRPFLNTVTVAGIGALHAPGRLVAATLPPQLGNSGVAGEEVWTSYEALLGVGIDDDLAPFSAFRISVGFVADPATHAVSPAEADASNPTGLFELRPSRQAAPYGWLDAAALAAATPDPAYPPLGTTEPCSMSTVAQAMVLAPGIDFLEPHFPLRLLLDAELANRLGFDTTRLSDGELGNDGGAEEAAGLYGDPPLSITRLGEVELPLLVLRASDGIYVGDDPEAGFRPLARLLPPVRGESAPRLDGAGAFGPGFEVRTLSPHTHNDVLLAEPSPAAEAIADFVSRWSP